MRFPKPLPDLSRPCFQDEIAALDRLEEVRWPNGPVCPYCGCVSHYDLRRSRPGVRKCADKNCRRQFTVKTNTYVQGFRIPTNIILSAIFLLKGLKDPIKTGRLQVVLGINYKSTIRAKILLNRRIEWFFDENKLQNSYVAAAHLPDEEAFEVRFNMALRAIVREREIYNR